VPTLADRFDAFLIDLDGVVVVGDEALPGAPEALAELRARRLQILFLTNDPRSSRPQHAVRLRRMGIDAEPSEILTSASATAAYLADHPNERSRNAYVIGTSALKDEIRATGLAIVEDDGARSADVVVVGGHAGFDYGELRIASQAVRAGARFVATNADPVFPMPDGLWPAVGAILAAVETAAGRRATVIGKPHPPMFSAARRLLRGSRPVMVGDSPRTDVAGGRLAGMATILVSAGDDAAGELAPDETPDFVVPSLLAVVRSGAAALGDPPCR
jgi:glycerol 3-phosphatase-2